MHDPLAKARAQKEGTRYVSQDGTSETANYTAQIPKRPALPGSDLGGKEAEKSLICNHHYNDRGEASMVWAYLRDVVVLAERLELLIEFLHTVLVRTSCSLGNTLGPLGV